MTDVDFVFLKTEPEDFVRWVKLTDKWKLIKCQRCSGNFTTQKALDSRVLHRKCGKSFILKKEDIIQILDHRTFGLSGLRVINEVKMK